MRKPGLLPRKTCRRILPAFLLLALAACAAPHDATRGYGWGEARLAAAAPGDGVAGCLDALAAIDAAVASAGTADAQAAPVAGFPHLRATRFLAALGRRLDPRDAAAFDAWTAWLAETAIAGRRHEIANLPAAARGALAGRLGEAPTAAVRRCTATLRAFDAARPRTRGILAATVHVPDAYDDGLRFAGLYPLTAVPVLIGFERWKDVNLAPFGAPPDATATAATVRRYAPLGAATTAPPETVAALLRRAADNPLGVPRPEADALAALAAAFAPVFAVDTAGDHDRIGTPAPGPPPHIDTAVPTVYVQASHALFGGEPLLQISYLAWFPERPRAGPLDLQAGRLDGLIWRVTIGRDGRPVLYDSIHACGCYHLFLPVPPTRLKAPPRDEPAEGTVVPADAPVLRPGARPVLHLATGTHYLRGLSTAREDGAVAAIRYAFAPMDALRSLPAADGGRRSLYAPDGLVPGTERPERYVLWPMGVPSAGAMRQWGTHATAFVGRRHFDDPLMLDRAFRR